MKAATSITVIFVRAADDLGQYSPEYQQELSGIAAAIGGGQVETPGISLRMNTRGAGKGLTDEFKLQTEKLSAGVVIAALSAWLDSHVGRKLQISIGDSRSEADSMEDLLALLKNADTVEWVREPKRV